MIELYNQILVTPFLNLLVWVLNAVPGHDFGVAIIIVTLIVRLILMPLSAKSLKAQRALQVMQPKLNEIKDKHKGDKQKQSEELMAFYKENKVNPFSSCLPMIVQFPIILALYQVFRDGLSPENFEKLYSFVAIPTTFDPTFFGLVDLSVSNLLLALIAGAAQFFQAKYLLGTRKGQEEEKKKKDPKKKPDPADMASAMSKQMVYIMPVVTVVIAMSLPSGLALYWITTTVFAIGQQLLIFRPMDKKAAEEEAAAKA